MPPANFCLPFCRAGFFACQASATRRSACDGWPFASFSRRRVCRGLCLVFTSSSVKVSLARSYPGRLFQVRVRLTDRVGPGSNVPEPRSSQRAYVFKGHTAGWLELPSEVGCEFNEALCFIIDTIQVPSLDPSPNISVSCQFMLNGVPVEFDVRLRQDRSIHLTTVRFSSGTGEVQFGARPINDGYWMSSLSILIVGIITDKVIHKHVAE